MIILSIGLTAGALVPWVASGAAPAPAVTRTIAATNFTFTPAIATVAQGTIVHWTFSGSTHTSTALMPAGYWNSGSRASGTTFERAFKHAGTFPYECSFHAFQGMTGTVKVPIKVAPGSGSTSTSFTITWAAAVPVGYAFDVQSKRPGATTFTTVFNDTVTRSTMRTLGMAGTWTWRARLVHTTNGQVSGWSPVGKIMVS
jgi:plastocyanin